MKTSGCYEYLNVPSLACVVYLNMKKKPVLTLRGKARFTVVLQELGYLMYLNHVGMISESVRGAGEACCLCLQLAGDIPYLDCQPHGSPCNRMGHVW